MPNPVGTGKVFLKEIVVYLGANVVLRAPMLVPLLVTPGDRITGAYWLCEADGKPLASLSFNFTEILEPDTQPDKQRDDFYALP